MSGSSLAAHLEALVASGGLGNRLCQLETSLSLNFPDLGQVVTLNLFTDARRGVTEKLSAEQSDISLEMSSALAQELFSGTANIGFQITSGNIEVRGPVGKLAGLWPAIQYGGSPRFAALTRSAEQEAK